MAMLIGQTVVPYGARIFKDRTSIKAELITNRKVTTLYNF